MAGLDENDSSASERSPLLTQHSSSDGRVCMEMKESVYSFMLFQPPLSRRRTGHYYTVEVMLAFALLALNLTLQVGLTLIAGNRIVQTASDFSKTLVNSEEATTPWADAIDWGQEELNVNRKYVASRIWDDTPSASITERCCDGAECAELKLPCCDRRGAKPHQHFQPIVRNIEDRKGTARTTENTSAASSGVAFLQLRKPSGSGHSKKSDESDGDGEEYESTVSSLCQIKTQGGGNQTLVCTPLSYEFLGAWKYLDVNGDGLWTLEEARVDEANLGCRLGLPVEEVFRSTCRGVLRDNEDTSEAPPYLVHHIPVSVSERRAVPKVFFDWWEGLAVICVVHDVSRCGELITRGIFDGAIRADDRFTKGGVKDLDTALDYCQRLLRPGGICEKTLPGAYMMYRSRVTEKCGVAAFSTGERYTNPYDDRDVMQTIQVTYSLYSQYHTASQPQFKFFLGLILFLWYVNLVGELKAIIDLADFILSFPVSRTNPLLTEGMKKRVSKKWHSFKSFSTLEEKRHLEDGVPRSKSEFITLYGEQQGLEEWERAGVLQDIVKADEVQEEVCIETDEYLDELSALASPVPLKSPEGHNVVADISRPHQVTCWIMLCTRVFILVYMFHVGSNFLITNHQYDDLLLNAVALAFIFELPEFLYSFLVSDELKTTLEGAKTEPYSTKLPTSESYWSLAFSKSLWGIVIIPAVVFAVVVFNDRVTTMPSLRALQCTCFQQGDHCEVASRFTRTWWNTYWQELSEIFATDASIHGVSTRPQA